MKLTNRRKQFLEQIVNRYEKTNEPIHYSDIAESIGVSKWTAYDVLKELEKHHFLKRDYAVNNGETGRSIIVYVPTEKSRKLFELQTDHQASDEDWNTIKAEIMDIISHANEHVKPFELLEDMKMNATSKVKLCACFIGVLLLYLQSKGEAVYSLTKNLIHASTVPALQISTFTGAIIGMIIESASKEMSPQMVELVQPFMAALEELDEQQLFLLMDLIKAEASF